MQLPVTRSMFLEFHLQQETKTDVKVVFQLAACSTKYEINVCPVWYAPSQKQ